MIDFLFQIGLSNAIFSLLLAVIALVIGMLTRRPQLVYLLWLLVLIKLLAPPIVSIPLADVPWLTTINNAAQVQPASGPDADPVLPGKDQLPGYSTLSLEDVTVTQSSGLTAFTVANVKTGCLLVLALGSLLAFAWSIIHILCFNRRLAAATTSAPREMQTAAAEIALRLKLRHVPTVYVTSARLSPMVWWLRGRIAVIIPAQLLDELDFQQWQWILAHELAHVRRRDYLVRWLEWLACICCWWNPVVWWAQRNLRAAEEICCDTLVLSCLNPQPQSYAKSLLAVVEFLAYPVFRPPAMASEINSGGFFLRRCRMIVSNKLNRTTSRWLQALVILIAVIVLPLGAHLYAKDDPEANKDKPAVTKSEAKKAEVKTSEDKKQSAEEYLKSASKEFQAKVAAGELTEGEAKAKYAELEVALALNAQEGACAKAEFKAAKAKLDAEVASGNISAKDAESMLKDTEKAIKERQAAQHADYLALAKAWDRQETLISEGMATFEEAVREYEQAKQQLLHGAGIYASNGQVYQDAAAKFQAAIVSGNMSSFEAFAKLSAVEMEAYAKEFAKAEQMYAQETVLASLEAAVSRGEITQEEAEHELQAYRADLVAKDEFAKQEMKKALAEEADQQKKQEMEKKAQQEQETEEK